MNIYDKDRINKPIINHLIVIDNFYDNPYDVRKYALTQTFKKPEFPIPGLRTLKLPDIFNCKEQIQKIIYPYKIINMESSFDCLFENHFVTFHKDSIKPTRLAALIYLNPDVELKYGTGFYKFKDGTMDAIELQKTHFEDTTHSLFTYDKTIWNEISTIGNLFNRLIIFNGIYYHKPLDTFGDCIDNGRLTQIFAIDIE